MYNTGLIGTVHSGVNNCKIIRSLLGELCGINASQFNTDRPLIVGLKRVFPSQLNTTSYWLLPLSAVLLHTLTIQTSSLPLVVFATI